MKRIVKMPLNNNNDNQDFYDEVYNKLLDATLIANIKREEINDIFTMSLIALEKYDYDSAINYSSAVSLRTDSIEQKIAAMHVTSIALEKNNNLTDAFLKTIYR